MTNPQKTKRPSMRSAINTHCKDCIYDKADTGTWRQQVEACAMTDCALYELRPTPSPTKPVTTIPTETIHD